jgi:hypothetical protein
MAGLFGRMFLTPVPRVTRVVVQSDGEERQHPADRDRRAHDHRIHAG